MSSSLPRFGTIWPSQPLRATATCLSPSPPLRACPRHRAQGKLAGANAAATASGRTLQAHHLQPYPVFFKSPEIELYAIGRTAGGPLTEERLDDAQGPLRYRCVVKDGTETVGVQMVGTREGFDALSCEVSVSRTPSSS